MNAFEKRKKNLLDNNEFHKLSQLFIAWTGNKLGADKQVLLESRIMKRLLDTKLTPDSYIKLLEKNAVEQEYFISALTTHKTDWFREPVHLSFLTKTVKSEKVYTAERPISIWSAACSTGEEVYSIGMSLLESDFQNFRILGTDISESCILKAEEGIYDSKQIDHQVPDATKAKYFLRSMKKSATGLYRIDPVLQCRMKWRQFNLVESKLPVPIKFDFIFLRNVLIYFDQDTIIKVIGRLVTYLRPGGYLIIGLSENISNYDQLCLKRVGNAVYRHDP